MIVTTTNTIEGRKVTEYKGLVSGEAVIGANVFRDVFASIRDFVGGRSGSYEKVLKSARDEAMRDMMEDATRLGADAIIGVDLDYEVVGQSSSMLICIASGTAVTLG